MSLKTKRGAEALLENSSELENIDMSDEEWPRLYNKLHP